MNDLGLFDSQALTQSEVDKGARGRARKHDPATSHAAAESIGKGAEEAIRNLYALPRALTADEICAELPEWRHAPTIKSALSRVVAAGFLEDSGVRRDSQRGWPMIVWTRA